MKRSRDTVEEPIAKKPKEEKTKKNVRFDFALYPFPLVPYQDATIDQKITMQIHEIYSYYEYTSFVPPSEWEKNWKDKIKRAAKLYNDNVCNDAVNPDYSIKNIRNENYPENNFIMIAIDADTGKDQGVMQVSIKYFERYSKIDVICAYPGYGAQLLREYIQYIDYFCPDYYMKLSALPNVLQFYQREGFRFRTSIDSPVIRPDFSEYQLVRDQLTDYDELKKFPEVLRVLQFLQERGINESKFKNGCKANESRISTILEHNCATDGYMMYRLPLGRLPPEEIAKT